MPFEMILDKLIPYQHEISSIHEFIGPAASTSLSKLVK